jgi:thiol:disulfide interchange protein
MAQPGFLRRTLPVLLAFFGVFLVLSLFDRGFLSLPAAVPAVFGENLSVRQAEARQEQTGRLVLVVATADWCQPCQKLKAGPLTDDDVVEAIERETEPVYLDLTDARRGSEAAAAAERLRIRSVPSLVLLRNGKVISRVQGYRSAESIILWLEQYGSYETPAPPPSAPAGA